MGRPSNREQRRAEILDAFARVLASHGYAGATIAAVATEAGVAAGLVHHHFDSKEDMLLSLLKTMVERFRAREQHYGGDDPLLAYADGALKLDERADVAAARCWVSLFAEALSNARRRPHLGRRELTCLPAHGNVSGENGSLATPPWEQGELL